MPKKDAKPLWGGFSESMHPALARISESLNQDLPLAHADIIASSVYARALARCGVLTTDEGDQLSASLEKLAEEFDAGTWMPTGAEDVHSAIEAEITARLGDLGGKLHTGRSRNDQVSTAFRLAVAERIDSILDQVKELQSTLVKRATAEMDTLLPAYTHVQRAQPIRLSHWLLSHFWPLERDIQRLKAAREKCLELPLGAGAVSGHPFGLDREWVAEELGFSSIAQNSLDAVGDRDFVLESAFACSMVALHLSRIAEELVLWSTTEFAYVRWPDGLATGSSLMPNKKNPDLAELVRGRSSGAVGDLVSLLVLVKGLPTSYQRDLQEDKPPIWRITLSTLTSLKAMTAAFEGIEFNRDAMQNALSDEILATEAADLLVARGVPFRTAHHAVAQVAAQARKYQIGFRAVATHSQCQLPEPLTAEDIRDLDVLAAIERRQAIGGTAKQAVMTQLLRAQSLLNAT
jgi:argininosuccinate lyase